MNARIDRPELPPESPPSAHAQATGGLFFVQPRLTALSILAVILLGISAFLALPRQEDPTMTERWATVKTWVPGATAERMESLVSEPIETRLREIPEIRQLSSVSRAGFSLVSIELYDEVGADEVDVTWSEIRDKLTETTPDLPAGATVPVLEMSRPLAATLVVEFSWKGTSPPELNLLSRLARALELKLANLGGTEETDLYGEADEEILVALDPHRLARAGLTTDAVSQAIQSADTKSASGRLRAAGTDMLVEVDAELDTIERIAGIPVSSPNEGNLLRLGDLGAVSKLRQDPPADIALHRGQEVVLVSATMQPGLNIGDWVNRARATVDAFSASSPASVGVNVVYDQNQYTDDRLQTLAVNLVFSLVLVLLILLVSMGLRSALIVGVSLPLSSAMVLIGMQLLDIPLHQMSVTGLIISLGLLIDNAIVITDDYQLRRSRGAPVAVALSTSVRHLTVPLFASTATTVFAFMPIALAPGGVGDFTGTLGSTVCLAVGSSFVLALTVIPALAGFIDQRWPSQKQSRWWHQGWTSARLSARYRRSVFTAISRPWIGITAGLVLPVLGFLLFPTLTNQFFPAVDRNQFQIQVQLPAHISIHETRLAVERIDALLKAHPDIVDSYWSIGQSSPRVYYNAISQGDGIASFAQGWVTTTSPEATRLLLPGLQRELMTALPEGEVMALPFEQGPPVSAPVELRIVGPDPETLKSLSLELRRLLSLTDGITYTRALATQSEPKVVFAPAEIATAQAGLMTGDFTRHLAGSLLGLTVATVQEGNTSIPVRVRLANAFRDDTGDLAALPVPTRNGAPAPLDQMGSWRLEPAASGIERFQGERVSTVQGFVWPFTLPAGVLGAALERIKSEGFTVPEGYRLEIAGEAEESAGASGNLAGMFLTFALAMLVVVTLSMNSFRYTAIIGLVAVLSFGLALFGVRLFGYPFGYMALVGGLGMIGIAINGAIIVISCLRESPAAVTGDIEAMSDVIVDATRHIVSTTLTTVGGFLPLVFGGGQFWPPLATAIAGGVLGSALIALYTVPTLFRMVRSEHRTTVVNTPETVEPATVT
ncbi:MAG: efflux RND transporter permease subunit [Gammaproteobacteria bacterium]|nr:efflux RND transporter permease subunit [Gammaproteobacteria bacterium]